MLEIGSLIDGKYKILNEVGHGGMSVVYLAMNERANKQWAIKEVRKDGVKDFEVVKQSLVAETNMLKKLSHPSLPDIVDVIDEDDRFLIVMDYIEGNSLKTALQEYGAQSQKNVIKWAKQLCDVLGYLHSQNPPIIYRDMKPANIMLKPDGNVVLIDFGTAREYKENNIEDTTCLGTMGYAAPEQYGFAQTTNRSDIYSIGGVLKELSSFSELDKIIAKCMKMDPANRYENVEQLKNELEKIKDNGFGSGSYNDMEFGTENNNGESDELPKITLKYFIKTIPGFRRGNFIFMIIAIMMYGMILYAPYSVFIEYKYNTQLQRVIGGIFYMLGCIIPYMYFANIR